MPWQQRLGNLPASLRENESLTMENVTVVKPDVPHLTSIKGRKFVMIEPMLGPVNLAPWIDQVDWVVAGSETGHEARELDLNWLREVRDISNKHRVPFFLKQVGTSHKNSNRQLDGRSWDEFPEGFRK